MVKYGATLRKTLGFPRQDEEEDDDQELKPLDRCAGSLGCEPPKLQGAVAATFHKPHD